MGEFYPMRKLAKPRSWLFASISLLVTLLVLARLVASTQIAVAQSDSDQQLVFAAATIMVIDDHGADDLPGQKDLNFLTIDDTPSAPDIAVTWGWDDTEWPGGNTGDACTLFDTNGNGNANYSLCIAVDQNGSYLATRLYSCDADSQADKCGGPTQITTFSSTGNASIQTIDPFGTTGRANNDCSSAIAGTCLTQDTVAALTVKLSDFGGSAAKLINVCSYPSQQPNSDPSDCVITPNAGFLTIVKVANPDDGTAFTFNASAPSTGDDDTWTINGSGSVQLIPYAATTTLDLNEVVPTGWQLDSASCVIQSSPTATTGTPDAPPTQTGPISKGVQNFEIRSGLETICTFTNKVAFVPSPSLSISKTPATQIIEVGGTATFRIEVKNTGNVALTGVTLSDALCTTLTPDAGNTAPNLPVGESDFWTCTVTNVTAGFTNRATATSDQTPPQSDSAVVQVANLTIIKTPKNQVIQRGDTATFRIEVQNTGEVALTGLTVADAQCTTLTPDMGNTAPNLPIGQSDFWTCTVANVTADFTNTATADSHQTTPKADTATIEVADLILTKSASPLTLPEPGGLVTFTVDIQNTSSTTLTLTALNDSPFGDITQVAGPITTTDCVTPQRLAPAGNLQGFRYICRFTVLLQGEPGSYRDIVTATLNDRHGNQIQLSDDATVTITDLPPTLTLNKTVTPMSRVEPGGAFVFTLTVTNTSVETVTITAINDTQAVNAVDFSLCLALLNQSLAPNASRSCQYTVNHTEAGAYDNTASMTVRDNENNPATARVNKGVTVSNVRPTLTLSKIATPTSRLEPGGLFFFTVTVTNTSVESVFITALSDTQSGAALDFSQCAALVGQPLVPNQSRSCTYAVMHTEVGTYENIATATVIDNENHQASSTARATVMVLDALPQVTLTKSSNPTRLDEPGGDFVFTLAVTNQSVEPVTITALTDSQSAQSAGFAQCAALVGQQLAPNQTRTCQYTVNHTQAGSYPNAAEVTVKDNENKLASGKAFATVVVGNTLPTVTLTKSATPTGRTEPGGAFVFTLVALNTTTEPVTITTVSDDQSALAVDFSQCTALIGRQLAPNQSASCQYTVSHTDAGVYPNLATVTVKDNENDEATGRDIATVIVNDALPSVSLTKTGDPTRRDEPGGAFVFTLAVTNNSIEPVMIADLTDTQSAQALDFSSCALLIDQELAPGQTRTCQYSVLHTNAGAYLNQAEVMVYDNEENSASDRAEVTVVVNDLLPLINVVKSAQPSSVLETGGAVLFTVAVANNSVEAITLTTLVDSLYGNLNGVGECVVPQTVTANSSYQCTFTKVVSGQSEQPHRNVVTATVRDDENNEATASDDATVTFIQVAPLLQVLKRDSLQVDSDGDGRVSPGDTLRYTVRVFNNGNGLATGVLFSDTPDAVTTLLVGSVTSSKGTVTTGNTTSDTTVEVEIGDILPNGAEIVVIVFDVVISPQIEVPLIRNQAVVTEVGGQTDDPQTEPSDDPDTPKSDDETITEVFAPTAEEETEEPIGSAIRRLFLPVIQK